MIRSFPVASVTCAAVRINPSFPTITPLPDPGRFGSADVIATTLPDTFFTISRTCTSRASKSWIVSAFAGITLIVNATALNARTMGFIKEFMPW